MSLFKATRPNADISATPPSMPVCNRLKSAKNVFNAGKTKAAAPGAIASIIAVNVVPVTDVVKVLKMLTTLSALVKALSTTTGAFVKKF